MIGQALAHSFVACGRLHASLSAMKVERQSMKADLDRHPEVLAEREQIVRRLKGETRGYESVKSSVERGRFAPSAPLASYVGSAAVLAREAPSVVRGLLGGPGPSRARKQPSS